jgi:hypothetical protein
MNVMTHSTFIKTALTLLCAVSVQVCAHAQQTGMSKESFKDTVLNAVDGRSNQMIDYIKLLADAPEPRDFPNESEYLIAKQKWIEENPRLYRRIVEEGVGNSNKP